MARPTFGSVSLFLHCTHTLKKITKPTGVKSLSHTTQKYTRQNVLLINFKKQIQLCQKKRSLRTEIRLNKVRKKKINKAEKQKTSDTYDFFSLLLS